MNSRRRLELNYTYRTAPEAALTEIISRNPAASLHEIRRRHPAFRAVSIDHLGLRLGLALDRYRAEHGGSPPNAQET